ncbi:hypothetical protein PR003_g25192 [Phytophthora rubi]|uniref:Uncharacterized protein n=1 Tax=Phytophthora rubi TaxID=129364 RepID=A0A6A3J4J1_9STRA|nr:hypothetical protein PR001_g22077 [Phytophthora rubi]KAE9290825.1 hypothetical protein PR003_g25192 [Phytophthora rubi]
MARRRDVDADDIGLVEGELDTNDLEAAGCAVCAVCALGARRLRLPTAPQVQLPASGAHVHSVTALVADAHALQRENQELRAQYEIVSAHNAGLAAHASVLHDRNLAILHRAREGYRAGMTRLEQALLSRERVERDYADLEGRVADFRARADRTEAAETLLRVERDSSAEQYRDLQAQLQAAQDQAADYAAQLARASAAPPPSSVPLARLFTAQGERDDARAERDDLRVALAAAQAALSPVQARADAAEAGRDRVRQLVATAEQQRDDALAERDRVTRVLVVAEEACDGALDMRDQACRISTALRRERDAAVTERDQARQAVAPLEQQRDTAVAERDRVRQAVAALEQQRDAAVAERGQARQAVADLEQRRDAAVAQRDQARLELTAQRQQRALVAEELRVTRTSLSQSRAESEAAQNLNVPLQDDLRRANALLVAHAEELRRGTTRIHELEESVATATTLRVAAESEMTRAKAGELGAASRAVQYRAGWMSVRRSSQRRREDDGTQVRRLNARVVELEGERDLAIRERDERAVAWRRMLRDARRGRELAQRVRGELADRLAGVVMGTGGHIDTAGLIRQLKATFAAAIDAAVPTSAAVPAISAVSTPAVPVPAPAASGSGTRTGTSAATAGSTTGTSPAGLSGSYSAPTSPPTSPSSGSQRSRSGAPRRSGPQSRASGPSGTAPASSSRSSPFRRSRRPSTVADTAASSRAAAQASSAATLSAARAREDAALFGSESSDSDDQARRAPSKRPRLHGPGSRSPSRSHTPPHPRSGSRSRSRSASVASTRSAGSARSVHSAGPARSAGSAALRRSSPVQPARSSPRGHTATRGGSGPGPGSSGDSSGDDSSTSSSSRASSSSAASSGSAGSSPAVPFFDPVIPPAGTPSGWQQPRYAPWPKRVRRLRLHLITVQELRTLFLPPPGWIIPRRAPPEPANWNRALVTPANVEALYATQPWRYLAQAAEAHLFAPGDAAFRPFARRLQRHIEHWAQAYWESTHELHVQGATWKMWRTARNSRRSHAGNHLNSLLQLAVGLFQQGLADLDLLLDPMMLYFPPAHTSIGRWYPSLQHATLQAALDDIDAQEPWRRFHRTPLTVAAIDAHVRCRVTRDHPAFHVPRLADKFVQQV